MPASFIFLYCVPVIPKLYFIQKISCILNADAQSPHVLGKDLFWTQMASLVAISRSKKVAISGPTPSNGPHKWIVPASKSLRHINNSDIN
jgi:hypothetical protein